MSSSLPPSVFALHEFLELDPSIVRDCELVCDHGGGHGPFRLLASDNDGMSKQHRSYRRCNEKQQQYHFQETKWQPLSRATTHKQHCMDMSLKQMEDYYYRYYYNNSGHNKRSSNVSSSSTLLRRSRPQLCSYSPYYSLQCSRWDTSANPGEQSPPVVQKPSFGVTNRSSAAESSAAITTTTTSITTTTTSAATATTTSSSPCLKMPRRRNSVEDCTTTSASIVNSSVPMSPITASSNHSTSSQGTFCNSSSGVDYGYTSLFLSSSGHQPVPSTADLIQQALLDLDLSDSDDDDDDMEFADEEDELEEDELDEDEDDYDELVGVNDNRTLTATSRDSGDLLAL